MVRCLRARRHRACRQPYRTYCLYHRSGRRNYHIRLQPGGHSPQQSLLPRLLHWICFELLVTPGYLTCKQHTFILEGRSMPSGLGTSTLWGACVSKILFAVADTSHHSSKPPSRRRVTLDRFGLDARRLTFISRDAYSKFSTRSSSHSFPSIS
ncbi:hypothetical protein PISMIDRAFT_679394 [Pisolithus microcarpus 441]|uniref:Uncharacterized protein n=1 Tax=Pisolithus microcarpus 441 TaxID=765257 RepID=A0A0C9Z313_9AGAM|nr:hypothetical protein PISMIDRAFT_679394 [Pisolithus microcarpus 441]